MLKNSEVKFIPADVGDNVRYVRKRFGHRGRGGSRSVLGVVMKVFGGFYKLSVGVFHAARESVHIGLLGLIQCNCTTKCAINSCKFKITDCGVVRKPINVYIVTSN